MEGRAGRRVRDVRGEEPSGAGRAQPAHRRGDGDTGLDCCRRYNVARALRGAVNGGQGDSTAAERAAIAAGDFACVDSNKPAADGHGDATLVPLLAVEGGRRVQQAATSDRAGHATRLEPRGLWIVGGNGRINPEGGRQRCLIVDTAENFEKPDWQAARAERRCDRWAGTWGRPGRARR